MANTITTSKSVTDESLTPAVSSDLTRLSMPRRRRLVRPFVVSLLSRKLRAGGSLHVATDVDVYADHVSRVLSAATPPGPPSTIAAATGRRLGWEGGRTSERPPWRPVTNYEMKAREAGRPVRDFCYRLVGTPGPTTSAADAPAEE